MNVNWPKRSILRIGANESSSGHILMHNYGPTTFLNPPKLEHVLPGILPQESICKRCPMGNHEVRANYRVHSGTLVRWPYYSSWPLAKGLSLGFRVRHTSGVEHRFAMFIVHHHSNRSWGCSTNITPWGIRVLHGFGNGFSEVVVQNNVIDSILILDSLEHTIIKCT